MNQTITGSQVATQTVGDLLERYLAATQYEPTTLEVRRRALLWSLRSVLQDPTHCLTGLRLETCFVAQKDAAGGHWLNTCGSAIRSFIRWAVQREILERDISRFWPKVRAISQRCTDPITPEEVERLLTMSPTSARLFFLFGVYFGARCSNLLDLDWSWISADWVVTIPAGKFKQRREHREPLHPRLIRELQTMRKPAGRVLEGLPDAKHIGELLKRIAVKAGVDPRKVYPHSLRATFATRLSEAGANLQQIAQLGGWASVEVVASRYIRPMPTDKGKEILGRI